jgi:D-cysteine desulfhydrase family pyridoxal phosphate-dependent enzyme
MLPSPLQRLSRLEAYLRLERGHEPPRLYIKRDDLLSLAMGGNKIRNLEFLIGDALALGATDVITAGRAQSNHCRLTAAAAVRAGLRCHIVLLDARPAVVTGNLLLDEALGAEVHFTGSSNRDDRESLVREIEASVRKRGGYPYVIPVGGSHVIGAFGHALAAAELQEQLEEAGEGDALVVLATATGGTQAGMLAGRAHIRRGTPVVAFSVAKPSAEIAPDVLRIARELAEALGAEFDGATVAVDDSELGDGYGIPTPSGERALALLARSEGILLDPTYTAKAFAGLLKLLEGAEVEQPAVVFVHTGGVPALFASP